MQPRIDLTGLAFRAEFRCIHMETRGAARVFDDDALYNLLSRVCVVRNLAGIANIYRSLWQQPTAANSSLKLKSRSQSTYRCGTERGAPSALYMFHGLRRCLLSALACRKFALSSVMCAGRPI